MDIEEYTLVELRQLAKERGTKNVSKLKKEDLIELLKDIWETNSDKLNSHIEHIENDIPTQNRI